MSTSYRPVLWNRQKRIYDSLLALGIVTFLAVFCWAHLRFFPETSVETVLIRALGSAALLILHIILCIGPLCRLDPRFLPLLYNRRHMGVAMFFLAAAHAGLVVIQYHAFGDVNPILSIFLGNTRFDEFTGFPFQPLGLLALVILFLMAATSHDFWLEVLTPPIWKLLHMSVYLAYLLLVAHVSLGVVQANQGPVLPLLLGLGMFAVVTLHLTAAFSGRILEQIHGTELVDVCAVDEIPEDRAVIVKLSGERLAVFRYDGKIAAVTNVCRHQNGPLGEGKIIDGCITCPWHGYQYRPEDGCSPPPFDDRISTFQVVVLEGRVLVHPIPNVPGTPSAPAPVTGSEPHDEP